MGYTKKVRDELMEDERNEDIIEKSREIDDGSFETWATDNRLRLMESYMSDNENGFDEYCKEMWLEEKE